MVRGRGASKCAVAALGALCAGSMLAAPRCEAGPALLFEPATGQVLYAEDADQLWYPASLTKLMTAYLVFEAVKAGTVTLETKVPLSEHARAQPATRIGLRGGIELNVDQAVRGMIMRSANDFSMALAELIGGSEEAFAGLMTATARRLGMSRTQFRNPHGLPDDDQVTTARDLAALTAALLRDFPDRAEVFSAMDLRIHKGTFHTQNDLLRTFEGADGMKTGFTCGAGYNVVASATRDGRRLVAIVLGERTRVARSERAAALLEHGFATYGWRQLGTPVALTGLTAGVEQARPAPDLSASVRIRKCSPPGPGHQRSGAKPPPGAPAETTEEPD
jgi:D-alanyl-D-alanine carboxypeptidase